MSTGPADQRHKYQSIGVSTCATVVVWLAVITLGWCFIANYEIAVDDPRSSPSVDHWPENTRLDRREGQPTLVLFLHPKCPCSRATLAELYRLYASLEENPGRAPDLVVVATVPKTADESWWNTDTTERAVRLVNSRLVVDRGGYEAAKFGATTSGFLMLFDGSGIRRFAGGITVARGHEGPSEGRDFLTAILRGQRTEAEPRPTFGCRLCLPDQTSAREVVNRSGQDVIRTQSG